MVIYHRHKKGQEAEINACAFLLSKGMKLISKNFRTRLGEIDLIMQDQDTIVFVEVRSRTSSDCCTAKESIDNHKIKKLTKTATLFLQQTDWLNKLNSRFDVVAIHLKKGVMKIEWIKNAF